MTQTIHGIVNKQDKLKHIINELNEKKILQTSCYIESDTNLVEELAKYSIKIEVVDTTPIEDSASYGIRTAVIRTEFGLMGIEYISFLYNEDMLVSTFENIYRFMVLKEVPSTSYEEIRD